MTDDPPADLSGPRPDSPELADAATSWRSAYVHIPFCARRCPYCDFAIVDESRVAGPDRSSMVGAYVDAVVAEIALAGDQGGGFGPLDAVDFGGGTPSRLAATDIGRVIDALRTAYGFVPDVEISLEANPEDWIEPVATGFADVGVTRVSLGVQSFDDDVLVALGRMHSADDAARAVEACRRVDIASVSVDLIIGHPVESSDSWTQTIEKALALEPDHVSTYTLTVEVGTRLAHDIAAGAPGPDDDVQADRYDEFASAASAVGIVRYEVSNHARRGHVCRYNLATWSNADYLGFGLGAHDHVGGVRSRNLRTIDRYMEAVGAGRRPRAGSERLSESDEARDALMLGLRRVAGVPLTGLAARFASSDAGAELIGAGLMRVVADRLVVIDPLRTDTVVRQALSVSERDC
ncbi:MAG: radical SAM family heme chaperone HemW [Acidimicrobiia bacterium]|nr:radical SAM family heme chaperone HemW [Acidimicrobiia bacterium]